MTVFNLMKKDSQYTGIGGYLNSHNRSDESDRQLLEAVDILDLDYSLLFLWVNSRNARHAMDQYSEASSVAWFVAELSDSLPGLLEEKVSYSLNTFGNDYE